MTEHTFHTTLSVPHDLPGRLAWLEARYLKNARDDEFQECLRDILQVGSEGALLPIAIRDPLNGETRGMQVIGASGDGKSVMIQRNLLALPGFVEMKDGTSGNYLHITVSPEATIKSLAFDIAAATGYGRISERTKAHEAWTTVRHRLKKFEIGLLWIDEAHHLLRGGAGRDAAGALQTLKNLLQGEGAVAVILSGVPQLEERVASDPETFRRYCLRQRLRPVLGDGGDLQRLKRFISACCDRLDLALPDDPSFAERIVFSQKGGLGRSILFAKKTIRRALINRGPAVSNEDARRTWVLDGGDESGPGPFDCVAWPDLRRLLEERGC
ncbi:ATP-binding protein [Paracoccus sp. C2R09]|nr:ATP-binding protein [Paracoccus sp. C2R09]MBU2958906.1 ATP-binding protein [Paracoccus sp. C2R09]